MDAFVVKVAKLCMPAGEKETATEEEKAEDSRPVEESATAEESTVQVKKDKVQEDIVKVVQIMQATITVNHTGNDGCHALKSVHAFPLDASNIRLNTPTKNKRKMTV